MTRTALAVMALGAALVVAGVAMIDVPIALIVAGVLVAALGVLQIDLDKIREDSKPPKPPNSRGDDQ